MLSVSVRSSGAIVALPPAAKIASSTSSSSVGGARGQHDMRAARGQRLGGGGADAAAGAGDERDLVGKRLVRVIREAAQFDPFAPSSASWSTGGDVVLVGQRASDSRR